MNAWCYLREFQTLIAGALALVGVFAGFAWNARLARLQHERKVQHERSVLRIALRAELQAIAEAYRSRIENLDGDQGRFEGASLSLDTMTDIYENSIQRIGLLSESQVRAVLKAYLLAQQLPERIKMLPGAKEPEPGFVWVPRQSYTILMQMHRNYLEDIDMAITALS